MDNLFEGGIAELEKIKQAIIDDNRISMELDQANDALTAKEKEIAREQEEIEDKIEEVVKAKRSAVSDPHDQDVSNADEMLKESIQRRNAAKEAAVNRRISLETAGVNEENVKLDFSVKTLLKNSGMPAFCGTSYYYSLFAPKGFMDYLKIIITALIAFALIPIIVILLIDTTTAGKVFIYIGIVVFFCLVYLAVFFWTQPNRKRKILELARPDIEKIKANKKEMKRLTKSIRNDKDESLYGLEELDNEIVRNRGIYNEAVIKREEAMRAFDEQIKPSVREEVEGARAEEMNRLMAEKEYLEAEFNRKQAEKLASERMIQQNYSTYIGKKNMDPEKLDQLIDIMESGKAGNILEALDVQKEESRIINRLTDAVE